MPTISIETSGCRECSICKEVCPTDVFDMIEADHAALLQASELRRDPIQGMNWGA